MSIDYSKRDVFCTFNVSICQSYESLHNDSFLHQLHNNLDQKEMCGGFYVISAEKLREIECILQEEKIDVCTLT